VVATYGATETAGGCVYDGVPLPGVHVRLDDGRIVVGGPTLAAGYLGRPAETAAAFGTGAHGREFRTDDLGRWVDGRLEVVGRADDVIVTGGEKVAPAAVERVLVAQPGVRAACVVGLPDPEWGAVVAAAVVLEPPVAGEPPARPDAGAGAVHPATDRLRRAVRAELGRAAVPRVLRVVDALPLRGIGKPDRAAVARLLATVTHRRPAV
jgi:O-succinylbenzoic acid--CoA ligase